MRRRALESSVAAMVAVSVASCTPSVPHIRVRPSTSGEEVITNFINWPGSLLDVGHSSYASRARAITPPNARRLLRVWRWRPDTRTSAPSPQLVASPTVFNGKVYIGATTGDFYALDEDTGEVLWKRFLGPGPENECSTPGINSTASVTVGQDGRAIVFTGGADGNLYTLDGATGAVRWRSPVVSGPGQVLSSPTPIGRLVYIGVSDMCHHPAVRGGVKAFSVESGRLVRAYWSVPHSYVGGSVRVGVAAAPGGEMLFVPTAFAAGGVGDSFGMVTLSATTLRVKDSWKASLLDVSRDNYFRTAPISISTEIGGEPVALVGSCNRDGQFYAFRQDDVGGGPQWRTRFRRVGAGNRTCLGGAVWDSLNRRLLVAGGKTQARTKVVPGAVRSLNPATGAVIWERVLSGGIWSNPSANGSGVVAVPNRGPRVQAGVFLLDENDGRLLGSLPTDGGAVLSQPVFADRYLFVATLGKGLMAFASPS